MEYLSSTRNHQKAKKFAKINPIFIATRHNKDWINPFIIYASVGLIYAYFLWLYKFINYF